MCGFAGVLNSGPGLREEEMELLATAMSDTLAHRGPDDSGRWVDAAAGIALGHRRLSIVDLSACGHQPMLSASGRYVVAFNGEIYNFPVLRETLHRLGHEFRGHSDTEVLLAAVCEWGVEAAVQQMVGMFAFALWDRDQRELHLCRDRMGEKPLYYGWMGESFLFGSELKALRAHPAWSGEVDREALTSYMRHACVPAPHSIYRGIRKLIPGSILTVRAADVGQEMRPKPFWSLSQVATEGVARPFAGSAEEATAELDALLRDAVAQQMVADVPLGAFLSGGIDSSTIVALMQAQSDRPVRTFTIGFNEEGYNEAEHAKAVARHLGTDHTELYVTPSEAMEVIPRLPTLYDEPFADSSQIPTFLLSELTRRSVTVSLSGDGGDELFGGYVRHVTGPKLWQRVGWPPRPVRRAAAGILSGVPSGWVDGAASGVNRLLPRRRRQVRAGEKVRKLAGVLRGDGPGGIYSSLISAWAFPEAAVLKGREAETILTRPSEWPALSELAAEMMYLDSVGYLPDDILVKVDRAAMGVSLETRVPFLDHRVVGFAASIPLEMKIRGGTGKWILRRVLDRYVPRELIDRPKMGFGVPIGEWIRGPLRGWAEELLDEGRIRQDGLLNPTAIRAFWREHLERRADRTTELWCVLMFQAWRVEQ